MVEKIDLIIENGLVFNSYFKEFKEQNIYIKNGKIYYIGKDEEGKLVSDKVVDAKDKYIVPGLVDIHMHIESSMVSPKAFGEFLASCGVTTIVSEPHEMANVDGYNGVISMIEAGKDSPIDIFYGIPSCVPASREELETTGGIIDAPDMAKLKENPKVVCVGEVMNYREIIRPNNLEISKFIENLRKVDKSFPIEGHCPKLVGLDLAKFLYLGIDSDHTEHTIEELYQRFSNGMFVEIQEKMLKKEVLDLIENNNLYEYFCFVTDDVMADTLYEQGQLNALVKKAISLGFSPKQAIYNASYTPSRRMNLFDRGVLAPGKIADMVVLDNLENFGVYETYKNGKLIYNRDSYNDTYVETPQFPESYYRSIKLLPINNSVFNIYVRENVNKVKVNVMEINDGSTRTTKKEVNMKVKDHILQWEDSGYLLATVFERYGKNNGIGFGFMTGDCHKRGAVASSYAHDNHNVLVAGSNSRDMVMAVNRIIEMQGGMVVVDEGYIKADLQLNVGGILSETSIPKVAKGLLKIRNSMIKLGYKHYNPIMSFGTINLTVSPALKLTDKGLVDVNKSCIIPLYSID